MATVIRLRREGSLNNPHYRVVVADKRSPRDGKFLELLGHYHPRQKTNKTILNVPRIDYWISKGAKPSETVNTLIKRTRKEAKATEAAV